MKHYPNILIIRGTGRNVGKTFSACRILKNLSLSHHPAAIKISPHFHTLSLEMHVLVQTEKYVVAEEKTFSGKDSSRMLQAGAHRAFYIQSGHSDLLEPLHHLMGILEPNQPVVVESGGLYDFLEPGLLIHIDGGHRDKNSTVRRETNYMSMTSGEVFEYDWNLLSFNNQKYVTYAGV